MQNLHGQFKKINAANPTQSLRADRVEKIVNNEIKQAVALEITKMKMTALHQHDKNLGINADLWVEEFHKALQKVDEAERNYAREKRAIRQHSDY